MNKSTINHNIKALECCAEFPDCDNAECRKDTLNAALDVIKALQEEIKRLTGIKKQLELEKAQAIPSAKQEALKYIKLFGKMLSERKVTGLFGTECVHTYDILRTEAEVIAFLLRDKGETK